MGNSEKTLGPDSILDLNMDIARSRERIKRISSSRKKIMEKKSKGENSQTAAVGNLNFFCKKKGPSATS